MTHLAKLYSGQQLVRILPLGELVPFGDITTPRMLPWGRLAEMDPDPSPTMETDTWRYSGTAETGVVTGEWWVKTFGTAPPTDMDPYVHEVPVTWLHYQRR